MWERLNSCSKTTTYEWPYKIQWFVCPILYIYNITKAVGALTKCALCSIYVLVLLGQIHIDVPKEISASDSTKTKPIFGEPLSMCPSCTFKCGGHPTLIYTMYSMVTAVWKGANSITAVSSFQWYWHAIKVPSCSC